MGFSGEIEFKDESLKAFFKDFNSRVKDVAGSKKRLGAVLTTIVYEDIINHFKNEEGSQGKWKEWSSSYELCIAGIIFFRRIGARTVMFFSDEVENPPKPPRNDGKILQTEKGFLRQSFKPQSYRTSTDGVTWFNNAKTKSGFPYAEAHNEGGPKLPKRDFMWLSDKGMNKVEEQTLKFMLDDGV